jgi:uncharacterized membrane protein
MRKIAIGLGALLVAWGFSLWAYPELPDRVAVHWGVAGRVDGWSSKTMLVLVFPVVGFLLGLLFMALPKIDPRKREVAQHAPTYWSIVNIVLVFLAAIQVMLVGYNLGWPIDIPMLVPVGVGVLLLLIGNLMPRMRPNWVMGIRTPWTLSSEQVWRKTHRLGGYCFMAMGLMMVAAGFVGTPATLPYFVGVIVVIALVPVVYSFFAWRSEQEATSTSPPTRE